MPLLPTLVPETELAQTWPHSCQGPQTSAVDGPGGYLGAALLLGT